MLLKLIVALVATAATVPLALAGPYDPQSYYFLAQYADAQCSSLTGITMMAVNKCFSQTLSSTQTNTASYVGFTTTQYAKATFTQGTTTTSGTFTLTSYSDSSCNNVVSGSTPITVTLPAAAQNSQYGPFGMMSACTNTLPGSTSTTLYNQGGAYTFTNKLEMEALLSTATQGLQGPVYGTFADPYCSVQNTNDAVGNQLPIYMQWALNGACTYSLLTKQFKSETCSSSTNLANTAAYSNTWRTFSDSTCTTQIATQTSPETDANFCTVSTDSGFPYYQSAVVGPYSGGYCSSGSSNKYLVLEQYYGDSQCGQNGVGPTAVNAILLNKCVQDSTNVYKMATFQPGTSAFASGTQGDSVGTLTIQAYSDVICATAISGGVFTLTVPTGVMGWPSTSCTQGQTGLTNYFFKGGFYFFDDYSKLQATITNNFGAGTVLGTFADSSCTQINTNTQIGGGLPIMVSYYNNIGSCVLNIATKTSLKTTCTGPTDTTTDNSATINSVYGALTGSITQYSDTNCQTVTAATTTYTTGGFCWSSAGTGSSNIVATVGAFTGGFCQLTNEKSYGVQSGGIATNDEAVEGSDVITGVTTDSPKCRAAYVAAQLANYPAGTTVTILGVTATGSSSRRLGTPENDHRELSLAGLRFRTVIRNPASTAAAIRNAFTTAGNTIAAAFGRRLGVTVSRQAATPRTLATRPTTTTVPNSPTFAPIVATPGTFTAGTVTTSANGANTNNACFAGSELVTLESGDKQMSEVEIGDRILTVNNKGEQVFSDVVFLPHGANQERTTFTVVTTETGRDLKMTANHILPAGACATPSALSVIAASQVKVGDCVQTVSGREQVVSVKKVEGKGIYTVIAMEELIVVNGIVATPFGGVNPTLANIYYNMHRLAYATFKQTTAGWMQGTTEMVWGVLSALSF